MTDTPPEIPNPAPTDPTSPELPTEPLPADPGAPEGVPGVFDPGSVPDTPPAAT